MVYYGQLSKGCQRCRQRKIKCDLRKPGCFRCEKAKLECPGFRNLADVIFRNESERIIRKARLTLPEEVDSDAPKSPVKKKDAPAAGPKALGSRNLPDPSPLLYAPYHSLGETAAHFFFSKYSCDEPPLSPAYQAWLTEVYIENRPNCPLRAAIEATGMSGVSNTYYSPEAAAKSKERYCRAIVSLNRALNDPVDSSADTTLMTVILLGIFEFVNFSKSNQLRPWCAHVDGALALLRHRGPEQYTSERGKLLFAHVRAQILYTCMQYELPVPEGLKELSEKFGIGKRGDLAFELIDLQAAVKSGEIRDYQAIHDKVSDVKLELEASGTALQAAFKYSTIDTRDAPRHTCFMGKRHIYTNGMDGVIWNTWRTLRILVNKVILENEDRAGKGDGERAAKAISIIRDMSTDICISAPVFQNTSRAATVIWSLYIVGMEELNPRRQRVWALEQLRRISTSTGIGQARAHAASVSETLAKDGGASRSSRV